MNKLFIAAVENIHELEFSFSYKIEVGIKHMPMSKMVAKKSVDQNGASGIFATAVG